MSISLAEVRELLIQALPAGSTDFYDLETPEAKISRLFTALSQMVKRYGFDTVDQLFLEINPFTIVQDIPDWEIAAGLIGTRTALLGSTNQRRNQIIGTLRGSGSFSLEDFRAAIEPFYKYQLAQRIRIVEPNRDNLRALHSYGFHDSGSIHIVMGSPVTLTLDLTNVDDFITTDTGAILSFDYYGLDLRDLRITISPVSFGIFPLIYGSSDAPFPAFADFDFVPIKIYLKQYANIPSKLISNNVWQKWSVQFSTVGTSFYFRNPTLFAEGMGRATPPKIGEGLSSSMFFWNPLAETTLLGSNPDIQGADLLLKKIKPAHTVVNSGYFEEKTVLIDYPNNTGDVSDLLGVWGIGTSDIFISTAAGNILKFDGAYWFLDTALSAGFSMSSIKGTSLQNIYSVGIAGEVLINRGLGWFKQAITTASDFKDVAVFDDKTAIIVGTGGVIYYVKDATSTLLTSPIANDLNGIYTSDFSNKTDIWAVGVGGVIIRSTDGINFTSVTSPTANELLSISGDGPNNIYAVGVNGTVIHWDGISWTSQTLAGGYTLNTVAMSFEDLDDVWIGASGGHVFHKGPYDSAFTEADVTSTTEGLFGSWLKSPNVMWMVGGNGTIIRYSPLAIFPDNVRALPDACFPS